MDFFFSFLFDFRWDRVGKCWERVQGAVIETRKKISFFLSLSCWLIADFKMKKLTGKEEAAGSRIEGRKINRRCLKNEFLKKNSLYRLVAFYKECFKFRSQQETVVGSELYD